jgi:hypothetical protein
MKRLACVLCLLVLTGCVNQAQVAAQQEAQRQAQEAQRQALMRQDDQTCRSYSALPGTDQYVNCRMNLTNNRARAAEAAEVADANVRAAALAAYLSHH